MSYIVVSELTASVPALKLTETSYAFVMPVTSQSGSSVAPANVWAASLVSRYSLVRTMTSSLVLDAISHHPSGRLSLPVPLM